MLKHTILCMYFLRLFGGDWRCVLLLKYPDCRSFLGWVTVNKIVMSRQSVMNINDVLCAGSNWSSFIYI